MRSILLVIVLGAAASVSAGDFLEQWQWGPNKCKTGVYPHPRSPFAVMLFCEDALGSYLSVVHLEPFGAPSSRNAKWTLDDRYWHDAVWGSDITGFKWGKDGMHLTVSTSPIYGSGGYFELDLETRTSKQNLPKQGVVSVNDPGPGYNINGGKLEELSK